MNNRVPSLPLQRRLSFKYARAAVLIALVLGALLAALQVYLDIQQERGRVEQLGPAIIEAVRAPTARAAYRLDPIVSKEIVEGLLHNIGVVEAAIIDDFGDELASARRDPVTEGSQWLSVLIGDRVIESSTELHERSTLVGRLVVMVYPLEASSGLTVRVLGIAIAGLGKSLLLSVILFGVFHVMGTKRVLAITERLFES
jgi:hypothetical protein